MCCAHTKNRAPSASLHAHHTCAAPACHSCGQFSLNNCRVAHFRCLAPGPLIHIASVDLAVFPLHVSGLSRLIVSIRILQSLKCEFQRTQRCLPAIVRSTHAAGLAQPPPLASTRSSALRAYSIVARSGSMSCLEFHGVSPSSLTAGGLLGCQPQQPKLLRLAGEVLPASLPHLLRAAVPAALNMGCLMPDEVTSCKLPRDPVGTDALDGGLPHAP
jgi:hypothetical protein